MIESSFTHRGLRIAFREYGTGPRAIVLVHGLLMDGRMFEKLAPALVARGNRVLTVDLPGHGASDQPHEMAAYSMTEFGRDVVALLDHLGLPQAVIGGALLGAHAGPGAGRAQPAPTRALVAGDPVLASGRNPAAPVLLSPPGSPRLS